jgi:hypothetical protein
MSRRYQPFATGRRITQTARRRASTLNNEEIGMYMDSALMQFGHALDQWRFKSGPAAEVALSLDVLMALWNEVEIRGLE